MGLSPIEYRPWSGKRTEHGKRFLVIAESIFQRSLGSKWFLGVLILGVFLTFAFPIIFSVMTPHESVRADYMASQLGGPLFFIFLLILAALVCSDLLSEDRRSNSLVLYLSRALNSEGYLAGKIVGAFATLALFAFVPSLLLVLVLLLTQSGSDYLSSAGVVGLTVLAGLWMTIFFLPLGLLVSSLTEKKTYAAVACFMVVFVLGLVSSIFSASDINWSLLGPQYIMSYSVNAIFGLALPQGMNAVLLLLAALVYTILPVAATYWLLKRRE